MSATLSLSQLTDLALGTPELGAVNFNVLHTLLHAIIQKVGISDSKANINEADKDFLVRKKDDPDTLSRVTDDDRDSAITGLTDDSFRPATSQSKVPYHQLEEKVAQLEKKFEGLNELPSNNALFEKTKSKGDSDQVRPVNDMWQGIQLKNRVDANESGIDKLMSLVQDMMSEISQLKDANEDMKKQLKDAKNIDDLMKRLKELEEMTNDLHDKFSQFPDPSTFDDFVTWSALEDSLKGLRENLNELRKPPVVIESASQTVATVSRPVSARPMTPARPASRASTPGPSDALQDLLEKLGKLTDKHDLLEERVKQIEDELKNKADKSDLEGIGVPADLLQQLKDLQEQMERLKKIAGKVKQLEDKVESLSDIAPKLADHSDELNALTSKLEELSSNLDMSKADLSSELDKLKTQLEELEQKVNEKHSELDEKVENYNDEVNQRIDDLKTLTITTSQPMSFDHLDVEEERSPSPEKCKSSKELVSNAELEKLAAEINNLNSKLKFLTQDMNRQLSELRKRGKTVDGLLEKMTDQIAGLMKAGNGLSDKSTSSSDSENSNKQKVDNKMEHELNFNGNRKYESVSDLTQIGLEDSDALSRMQQAVLNLQAELERLDKCTQMLSDDNTRKQKDIESLFEMCNKLDENKADKEFVQNEVEVKADKRLVDGKVNRSLFDSTCDELNKLISDILAKLSGHDEEWKKAVSQLNEDLDGKLDRLEFGPIKDELDRQLRALLKKLKGMHMPQYDNEDDAAGIRKQLIQRFHCISCDRPVDMQPQGPIPSIPATSGLPASKSTRPYTTFELEQIRQHAKSLVTGKYDPQNNDWVKGRNITNFERALIERQVARLKMHDAQAFLVHFGKDIDALKHSNSKECINVPQPHVEVMDLYATQRACGGSHTMTYPHRRQTRMTHMNTLFREDDPMPSYRNELEIHGADGHVYKGRQDQNRLPNLQSAPGTTMTGRLSPSMPRRAHTSMEPYLNEVAPPSPRPGSARLSRPTSGRLASRPMSASARGGMNGGGQQLAAEPQTTQVPTAPMTEGSTSPPPPALVSEGPEDADATVGGGLDGRGSPDAEGPPARSPSPVTQPDDNDVQE